MVSQLRAFRRRLRRRWRLSALHQPEFRPTFLALTGAWLLLCGGTLLIDRWNRETLLQQSALLMRQRLHDQGQLLCEMTDDYAAWDLNYEYQAHPQAVDLREILQPTTYIRNSTALYLNDAGKLLRAFQLAPDRLSNKALTPGQLARLQQQLGQVRPETPSPLALVGTDRGWELLCRQPLTNSVGSSPPRGGFGFLRPLPPLESFWPQGLLPVRSIRIAPVTIPERTGDVGKAAQRVLRGNPAEVAIALPLTLQPTGQPAVARVRLGTSPPASRWVPMLLISFSLLWLLGLGLSTRMLRQKRRLARRQQRANFLRLRAETDSERKSRFLAMVSHELRTPMNGILGLSDSLLASPRLQAPEVHQPLELLHQSAQHLLGLLNNLLDFEKIAAGRMDLHPQPLELRAFLHPLCQLFQLQAEQKQVHLEWQLDPKLPTWIRADFALLRQVLLNLLGNALKFTDSGSIQLQVSAQGNDTAPFLRFEVIDSGIGIRPEQLESIFEPFEQATSGLSRSYGGTALGLAITRQLVTLMDGSIRVDSQVGVGSRFTVDLPLQPCEPGSIPTPEPGGDRPPEAPRPQLHILAAEDNPVNRQVLVMLLQRLGQRCTLVEDGQAVLKIWPEQPWDVVLMDLSMPTMDGFTATQILRTQATGDRHIPIVAVTANAQASERQHCLENGFDDYLTKPLTLQNLEAMLQRLGLLTVPAGTP